MLEELRGHVDRRGRPGLEAAIAILRTQSPSTPGMRRWRQRHARKLRLWHTREPLPKASRDSDSRGVVASSNASESCAEHARDAAGARS